jgi:hypothetical protein
MATDFNACGFGAITPELILRSLIGCVVSNDMPVLRSYCGTAVVTTPVHCGSWEDFQINLRRALVMANDGYVAIRINYVTSEIGTCGCAVASTWWDYFNSLFGEDSEGNVWVNFACAGSEFTEGQDT